MKKWVKTKISLVWFHPEGMGIGRNNLCYLLPVTRVTPDHSNSIIYPEGQKGQSQEACKTCVGPPVKSWGPEAPYSFVLLSQKLFSCKIYGQHWAWVASIPPPNILQVWAKFLWGIWHFWWIWRRLDVVSNSSARSSLRHNAPSHVKICSQLFFRFLLHPTLV